MCNSGHEAELTAVRNMKILQLKQSMCVCIKSMCMTAVEI